MSSENAKKAMLQAYLDRFNAADAHGITELFAENATVEDPIGTPPKHGKAEILAFYVDAMKNGAKLTLAAPMRGSYGNAAAMAFDVAIPNMTIRVIDVMTFDDAGKIATMQAYFGPDDFIPG
jgi:steroid delta-isomerase